jgi:uncharacterized protein YcbX
MRATVARLWRYPVKSMLGEACEGLELDARGALGDRAFAVCDVEGKLGSGKSTRRFRKLDGLFGFSAAAAGDAAEIAFPDGRRRSSDDPGVHAALAEALGVDVRLEREQAVPHHDARAIHIVSTSSLAWLRSLLPDAGIDERRFRPNLVVETGGSGQVERDWIGRILAIDSVRLKVSEATERCAMVTHAQAELPADQRVLRMLASEAQAEFGVYAEVVTPGRIARGAVVELLD